jgi:hypothetical protein
MICFPLDNTPYEAKDMGTYLATRTRGVFSSDGNLAVTPGESGLSVSVSPGLAWLKWSDFWGVAALQAQVLTLDLDTADGALKRIDAIVCRLDKVNNRAEIVVKKGAPSSAPIVVPPVRDANYDELYIATVLIGAGVISISASAITDQRLNEEYCGLMRDGVTGIPTAQLQEQVQQLIDHLRAEVDGIEQGSEVMLKTVYDADGDGVVDEAEKVSNALTLKNAAGEVVATFDGSEAAILQLTAALVGALGKTEKAADSSKLAGLAPVVDNPGPNNRNTWYFPFTGTNNKDGTRKYYAALYADEATRAANKVGGGALVDTNDGRLSNARRASNITMGYDGNLWISYS